MLQHGRKSMSADTLWQTGLALRPVGSGASLRPPQLRMMRQNRPSQWGSALSILLRWAQRHFQERSEKEIRSRSQVCDRKNTGAPVRRIRKDTRNGFAEPRRKPNPINDAMHKCLLPLRRFVINRSPTDLQVASRSHQ